MLQNDYLIRIEKVSHSFGEKTVLKDIDFSIGSGEFVTLLGPSGCGKTTLLRLIAGFQKIQNGRIYISGQEVTEIPPHLRPVNTVFQRYALFPHLNVFHNIAFGLNIRKLPKNVIKRKVEQVLKMVSMTDYEERDVDSLSGGQQQRVAIARAIVNEPKVLLLDEPLAALDLKMRKEMQMEIKAMHKKLGITFIYVTHDQEEALTLSDRIVVMSEGEIQQIGSPDQIYNEPVNAFVADFIGESNILNGNMVDDELVEFAGHRFECVDKGFGTNTPVDVIVRPEDIYIFEMNDMAQFAGKVISSVFKGVHYEMTVVTPEGFEFLVHDYHLFEAGRNVGMRIKPTDIHVMKKERLWNIFDAVVVDKTHIRLLGSTAELAGETEWQPGTEMKVKADFDNIVLQDNPDDGLTGATVKFILYKGNHYHIMLLADNHEYIYANTNDTWDKGDRVGITFLPGSIEPVPN